MEDQHLAMSLHVLLQSVIVCDRLKTAPQRQQPGPPLSLLLCCKYGKFHETSYAAMPANGMAVMNMTAIV